MVGVGFEKSPARSTRVTDETQTADIQALRIEVHDLVLEEFPDCWVRSRKNGVHTYIPREWKDALVNTRDHILMTVWAEKAQVKIQIKPSDREAYDSVLRPKYRERMRELFNSTLLPAAKRAGQA